MQRLSIFPATYLVFARKTVTWRVSRIAKSLYGREQRNLIFRGSFARSPAKVRAQNGKLARLAHGRTPPCRDCQLPGCFLLTRGGRADRLKAMMGDGADSWGKIGCGKEFPGPPPLALASLHQRGIG